MTLPGLPFNTDLSLKANEDLRMIHSSPLTEQAAKKLQASGLAVIKTEIDAIQALTERMDQTFSQACHYMFHCTGRIVVIGMGKSGHIGSKIAATLASTGSPAFFVHPGEASHGDLGMITPSDVVVALSNSGETNEMLTILPLLKRLDVPLITMTGNPNSTLSKQASVNIDVSVEKEACPLGLAPTSSTTAALVMGDAMAVALLEARGFTAEDYAFSHPGGSLGKRLLLHVSDIMHAGQALPAVSLQASLDEALQEMSAKGLGMTAIVDADNQVLGIYTDGDLRRSLARPLNIREVSISEVMNPHCITVPPKTLAFEALQLMKERKIRTLLVVDENQRLVGAFTMADLLRAGVV